MGQEWEGGDTVQLAGQDWMLAFKKKSQDGSRGRWE